MSCLKFGIFIFVKYMNFYTLKFVGLFDTYFDGKSDQLRDQKGPPLTCGQTAGKNSLTLGVSKILQLIPVRGFMIWT